MKTMHDDPTTRDREALAELSPEEAKLVTRIDQENAGARKSGLQRLAEFPMRYGLLVTI